MDSTLNNFSSPLYDEEQQASGAPPPLYIDTRKWSADALASPSPSPSFASLPIGLAEFFGLAGPTPLPAVAGQVGQAVPIPTPEYSDQYLSPTMIPVSLNTGHTVNQADFVQSPFGELPPSSPQPAPVHDIDVHTQAQIPPGASHEAPSPPQHGAATPTASAPSHDFRRRVPPIDPGTADALLALSEADGRKAYTCLWQGCGREPFKRTFEARKHVLGHLGPTRIFECVECLVQFATESSARRHRDTRTNKVSCAFCNKVLSRKDYRNVHQRESCPARPLK